MKLSIIALVLIQAQQPQNFLYWPGFIFTIFSQYLQFLLSTHYLIMEYQVWYLATDLERCWSCPEPKPSPPTSENEDGDRIDDGDASENEDGKDCSCWYLMISKYQNKSLLSSFLQTYSSQDHQNKPRKHLNPLLLFQITTRKILLTHILQTSINGGVFLNISRKQWLPYFHSLKYFSIAGWVYIINWIDWVLTLWSY